jgi:alpha-amylase
LSLVEYNSSLAWLQSLYQMFKALNIARQSAIKSHPSFLTETLKPYLPNNRTLILHKAPLLTILSNYGSSSLDNVNPIYLPPQQTGYKPLLPIIDILSTQIFSTDPRGGLTIPIVNGEPRVLLPLAVHLKQATKEEWENTIKVVGVHRRTPSLGRVLSWLGGVAGSKHTEF